MPQYGSMTLFKVVDLKNFLDETRLPIENGVEIMPMKDRLARLRYETGKHPFAILISPYANEREIVDYVKKTYNLAIKPVLDKYKNPKVKLGILRKRNATKKARNKFIYENRNLSTKELAHLVAEKFEDILEYTHINKIIKEEKKKISVHK